MASKPKPPWGASMGVGVVNLELVSGRVRPDCRVLDAGCGLGFVVAGLAGDKRHGIDRKPELVEAAVELNPDVEFSVRDAADTGFPSEFFDIILCLDVLEHTESQRATVRELARVLAKGGRLLVSTPIPEADFLPGARGYTRRLHRMWGHKKLVSRSRLIKMLDEEGLRVEDEVYYMHLLSRLGILMYNILYSAAAGNKRPWDSIVLRLYERILRLACKLDNATKLFGPFETLFVAVKD